MRVMTRLQNITYLQTVLEKALAGEPSAPPPSQGPWSNSVAPQTLICLTDVLQGLQVSFHQRPTLTATPRRSPPSALLRRPIGRREVVTGQGLIVVKQCRDLVLCLFRWWWEEEEGCWEELQSEPEPVRGDGRGQQESTGKY